MFSVIMLWAASIDGHLSSLVACHCTYLYLFNLFVYLANKLSLSLSLSLPLYRADCDMGLMGLRSGGVKPWPAGHVPRPERAVPRGKK